LKLERNHLPLAGFIEDKLNLSCEEEIKAGSRGFEQSNSKPPWKEKNKLTTRQYLMNLFHK
jgi:hypothetical protein